MPTPTTNLSFASIQTEFGGSNPISMSEYYKGGTYVPSGQATSATDGTAIATSGAIRIGTFRGLTKTAASTPTGLFWEVDRWVLWPTTSVTSTLTWQTNGTVTIGGSGSLTASSNPNWYTPTTTGAGNSYWIRFTQNTSNGGTLGGDALNTWHALSTGRMLTLYRSSTGFSTRTFTVQIATDSGGSNIVSSGTATLSANVDV